MRMPVDGSVMLPLSGAGQPQKPVARGPPIEPAVAFCWEGAWQNSQGEGSMIQGKQIYWATGDVEDLQPTGPDSFSINGGEFYAQLSVDGCALFWSNGLNWTRQPQSQGAQPMTTIPPKRGAVTVKVEHVQSPTLVSRHDYQQPWIGLRPEDAITSEPRRRV